MHPSGGEEQAQHKLMLLVDTAWMGWRGDSPDLPAASHQAQTAASPAAGLDVLFPLHRGFMRDDGSCGLCWQPQPGIHFTSLCAARIAQWPLERLPGGDSRIQAAPGPQPCACVSGKTSRAACSCGSYSKPYLPWLGTACCGRSEEGPSTGTPWSSQSAC